VSLRLELPADVVDELVERVAERAAALVLEQLRRQSAESEFLTPEEAAEVLRSSRQRVYDLLSDGRLERFKDGSRVLVKRADLVAHLRPNGDGARTARRVAR
jgi:excisionase family DNA binding protein